MSRTPFVALALVFLGAGIGLLTAAVRSFARRRAFLAGSVVAEGRVVGFREEHGPERSFYPRVEFRAAGRSIRFESETGSEHPSLSVGDRVRVRHRAGRPDDAELDDFFSLWGATLVFGVLGSGLGFVGVAILAGWIPA